MSVWDGKKQILFCNGSVEEVNGNNPTPVSEVIGTDDDLFVMIVVGHRFSDTLPMQILVETNTYGLSFRWI